MQNLYNLRRKLRRLRMSNDSWDLSWCRQGNGYKYWLPSMRKNDQPEVKEKTVPEQPESKNISTLECFSCGAKSFMPVEKCDICRKPFYPPKAIRKTQTKPPPSKQNPPEKRLVKMSFKEVEATKIKLNKLNEKYFKDIIKEPPPSGLKTLKTKIDRLQTDLENNIQLVFLFQPAKD